MENVCKYDRLRLKGVERDAIEEVVKCLHLPFCPNKSVDLSKTLLAEMLTHSGMSSRHSSAARNHFTTQAGGQLQMYQVGDPIFGTRGILSPTHRCWGVWHAM
jgi:hypothetical protein